MQAAKGMREGIVSLAGLSAEGLYDFLIQIALSRNQFPKVLPT